MRVRLLKPEHALLVIGVLGLESVPAVNKDELHKLWEDERHWGHGPLGGYFCKQDPRLVVPKRRRLGGTFNLAHRWAIPILTAIILLLVVLVLSAWLSAGIILLNPRG